MTQVLAKERLPLAFRNVASVCTLGSESEVVESKVSEARLREQLRAAL